jgi:acid phosphatase type 7
MRIIKKSILAAPLALLVAGAQLTTLAQKIEKIVGGPFVVNVTQRSATIAWVVQGNNVTVRPQSATSVLSSPALRTEKTTLTSLQPNTRYEYNISSDADAGKGSFKTPPTGSEPYRFVVYGDNRTRHDVHRRVIAELMKHELPDFILQTGDMVENGNDAAQWPVFFEIERELLRQTVFFPSMGNHERSTHYFGEIFHDGPSYYSFDWGNSHITVIDSELESAASNDLGRKEFWSQQLRWIEEDLQGHQSADYRFVVAHHPPYTAVSSRQGANAHMTALTPMFERYHVSAGFFGHDHNYQHYLKNGVHYVTTGGGGAPLYDVRVPPAGITQQVASIENFVGVDVKGKVAHFKAIAIDGKTLDEFDIESPVR